MVQKFKSSLEHKQELLSDVIYSVKRYNIVDYRRGVSTDSDEFTSLYCKCMRDIEKKPEKKLE